MKLIKNKNAQRSVVSVFFWILVIMLIVGIGFYTSNLGKITGFAVRQTTVQAPAELTGYAAAEKQSSYYKNLPEQVKKDPKISEKVSGPEELKRFTGWDCSALNQKYCTKQENQNTIVATKAITPTSQQPAAQVGTSMYIINGVSIPQSVFKESGIAIADYVTDSSSIKKDQNKYTVTKDRATQTFFFSGDNYWRTSGDDVYVNDNKITSSALREYIESGQLKLENLQNVNPPQNTQKLELGYTDKIITLNAMDGTVTTIKLDKPVVVSEVFYPEHSKGKIVEGQTIKYYKFADGKQTPISLREWESQQAVGKDQGDGTTKITTKDNRDVVIPSTLKIIEHITPDNKPTYTIGDTADYVSNINGNTYTISDANGNIKQTVTWDKDKKTLEYKSNNDALQQRIYFLTDGTQATATQFDKEGSTTGTVQIGDKTLTVDAFQKLVPADKAAGFSKTSLDSLLQKLPGLEDAVLTQNVLTSKDGAQTYAVDGKKITFAESKPNVNVKGTIADFTKKTEAVYTLSNKEGSKKLELDDAQYQSLQSQIKLGYFSDNYKVNDDKTLVDGSKIFYKTPTDIPAAIQIADSLKKPGTVIEQQKDKIKTYYSNGEFAESKSATSYVKYSQDYYPNEVNGIKIDYGNCVKGDVSKNVPDIPCTTSAVFTLKDPNGKPIDCNDRANAENCKAAKSAVLQSRVGIALTAAYQAALGASALGNFLFGTQAFEGWKNSIDDLFTRSILGIVASPEDFFCRSYIDKPGEGYALAPSPSGFAQAVAHIEADRSTAITYPNATDLRLNITEYLYKITFAVTAPNDQNVDFNVYLYPGERPLFVSSKHLDKGSTHREAGSSARVKYSRYVYDKVCIKFTSKVNFPDTICNRINVYSEPTVLYGTAMTPEQVAAAATTATATAPTPGSPSADW